MSLAAETRAAERAEWLEWRRDGLGGSDIAGVLSLSTWESPWSIWANKIGLIPDRESMSEAMEFGQRAEPMLAEYFEDRTGLWVSRQQQRCVNANADYQRCTLDGFGFDRDTGNDPADAVCAVEFKTTADPPEAWLPNPPVAYSAQATWITIVTGFAHVMFGVLHMAFGHPQFRVYEYQPAADDIALVARRAREFWIDYVIGAVPPPIDGSDATTEALKAAYPADPALDALAADSTLVVACERILANKQRQKDCQKIVAENENYLRAALEQRTTLVNGVDDRGRPNILATYKSQHRDAYVVEASDFRVLRVKASKEN